MGQSSSVMSAFSPWLIMMFRLRADTDVISVSPFPCRRLSPLSPTPSFMLLLNLTIFFIPASVHLSVASSCPVLNQPSSVARFSGRISRSDLNRAFDRFTCSFQR